MIYSAENVKFGIAIQGDSTESLTQARFVGAILRLVGQPQLQEQIRKEMMPWALQHYDWNKVVIQLEELFINSCKENNYVN